MECKECGNELYEGDLNVKVAIHDDNLFDMNLLCDKCGASFDSFVSIDDFIKVD